MVPAGEITESTVNELADAAGLRRRDHRRRQLLLPRRHPPLGDGCAEHGIDYIDCGTSGGVFGLERGYCLMIGGPDEAVERLDPIFATIAPGRRLRRAHARAASGDASTAENGYLHCGPSGAGHFVKMVHNGIEYGIMAAYAEGLNILKNADAGKHAARGRRRDGAAAPIPSTTSTSSTSPRSPRSGAAAAWSARGCST